MIASSLRYRSPAGESGVGLGNTILGKKIDQRH